MPKTAEDPLAEAEIRDGHIRYGRADAWRDEAAMRDCFHPDAVIGLHEPLDVGAFLPVGRVTSRTEMAEERHGPRRGRRLDHEPSFIIRRLSELHLGLAPGGRA